MTLRALLSLLMEDIEIIETNRYAKDLKQMRRGSYNWAKDQEKLNQVLAFLRKGIMPLKEFNAHKMGGGKHWELHIGSPRSNWLLFYDYFPQDRQVYLLATGTHSTHDNILHNASLLDR